MTEGSCPADCKQGDGFFAVTAGWVDGLVDGLVECIFVSG